MRKYTVAQAARVRKVHPVTIRNWLIKGILPDRRPPGTLKHVIYYDDLFPQPKSK